MRGFWVFFFTSVLVACGGSANNSAPPPPQQNQLTVSVAGSGTVTSSPAGISCPTTCKATFNSGTAIALTAVAASGSSFSGFAGACSGTACQLTLTANKKVSATFAQSSPAPPPTATLENSVNHIIFMLQENRSFDHYFGHLPDYWSQNGFPQATNGTTFDAETGDASNVDPAGGTVTAYQLSTPCVENPSPSWNE